MPFVRPAAGRGAGVVLALLVGILAAGCTGPEPSPVCEVTTSYRADIRLADEHWHIEERLLLDTQTRSTLADCLDPELGRRILAGSAADLPTPVPDYNAAHASEQPGVRQAVRQLHRASPTVAAARAEELLGISEDDVQCLATVCPTASEILDGAYAFVLDDGVRRHGWSPGPRRDGQPTYARTREEPAVVPSRGWTTNELSLPAVPLGRSSVLLPAAGSHIAIVGPKATVARTFPEEVQRADTLQDGNEQVVVELENPAVTQVRVDVLSTSLRSPPGQLLYGLSGWSLWPLTVAALAVLGFFLLRVVARESVSALAARLVRRWGSRLRRWRGRDTGSGGAASHGTSSG